MKKKRTVENYLKAIYLLSKNNCARSVNVAEKLKVSRPTVSVALKELQKEGYLLLDDSHEIHLTPKGREIAQKTFNMNQIIEILLLKFGVNEKTASEDACKIEHLLSPESYAALKNYVENCLK